MTDEDRDRGVIPDEAVGRLRDDIAHVGTYEGELEARVPGSGQPDRSEVASLETLESTELRSGETDDPFQAAEEGLTWVPPVDPPTAGVADDGDPRIGAGFGTTAGDEPFDADHHGTALPPEDEVTARVREALLADAATSGLADALSIETEGGAVRVSGVVSDLEDEEHVLAVISAVDGVVDVTNRLRVEGLD
jgi:hypothetical protein